MSSPLTESELLDALASGVLLVLPNARAARALRHAYDQRQRATNSAAWDSPAVLSWADWTRSLWTELVTSGHELRLLLNAAQEHSLWREIITSSKSNESLSSPDALAELAGRSFALAAAHCIPVARLRSSAITHDSRSFAAWVVEFSRLCQKNNYLPAALLEDVLREHAAQGHLAIAQPILLAGFGELTPAQSALLDALRSAGATISLHALANTPQAEDTLRASVLAQTPRDEQLLAARWIRRFVAERAAKQQPTRIAVIPLGAEDDTAALECIFREHLSPELQRVDADLSSTPWEFAAAPSLATHPLATTALDLLRLAAGTLSLDRISGLLRSPFLGAISERAANARFDAFGLRRDRPLQPQLTPAELLGRRTRYLQHPAPSPRPAPTPWLPAFAEAAHKLTTPAARSFADWAELIRTLLRAANFPGERVSTAASAIDVELLRAWDSTLDLLATLDFRGQRVSFADALTTLERLAHTTPCAAPHTHAPVQVMSLAEAEGSLFDAVVLLHATDQAWPATQRTDPLLAWPLQRELGLPGADKLRDADRAHNEAVDLFARSGAVFITCAEKDVDGDLRPSSLLKALHISQCEPTDLNLPKDTTKPFPDAILGEIEDIAPLPPLPSSAVHGGAHLLQLQAACGFRAFAELRLRARELEEAPLGLDALQSGNLIHKTLELFWKEVKSQEALRVMSAVERDRILALCINTALSEHIAPTDHWSAAYLTLQRERLHKLIDRWMEVELTRPPFTVLQREVAKDAAVGPLSLRVRLDRIDQLEDGNLVYIDFKTGSTASPKDWDGDRPDEPQLPLYSLLAESGRLKGLLFGKVRPGKDARWLGLTSDAGVLSETKPKHPANLDARIAEWREILTALAEDFASGHTTVDPKGYPKTCKHCGQRLLCRLNPDNLQVQDEEDEEVSSNEWEDVYG